MQVGIYIYMVMRYHSLHSGSRENDDDRELLTEFDWHQISAINIYTFTVSPGSVLPFQLQLRFHSRRVVPTRLTYLLRIHVKLGSIASCHEAGGPPRWSFSGVCKLEIFLLYQTCREQKPVYRLDKSRIAMQIGTEHCPIWEKGGGGWRTFSKLFPSEFSTDTTYM